MNTFKKYRHLMRFFSDNDPLFRHLTKHRWPSDRLQYTLTGILLVSSLIGTIGVIAFFNAMQGLYLLAIMFILALTRLTIIVLPSFAGVAAAAMVRHFQRSVQGEIVQTTSLPREHLFDGYFRAAVYRMRLVFLAAFCLDVGFFLILALAPIMRLITVGNLEAPLLMAIAFPLLVGFGIVSYDTSVTAARSLQSIGYFIERVLHSDQQSIIETIAIDCWPHYGRDLAAVFGQFFSQIMIYGMFLAPDSYWDGTINSVVEYRYSFFRD